MEEVGCSLCQAKEAREFLSVFDWYWSNGGPFTIVRCCQCGLAYLNPRPSGSEVDRYNRSMWRIWSASEESKEYVGSSKTARYTYPEILGELKKLKPQKGRLLEVGSGQGGFLKACQDDGWSTYGIDISDESVAYAKSRHGLDTILAADLLEAGFEEHQFDVVIMNHLIEHLADPRAYLAEAHRILRLDGILCISTPNIDSLSAKVFGEYWVALFVPLHLVLFSPTTLSSMLRRSGFSVIKVSHFSRITNSYDLLRSLSCVIGLGLRRGRKLLGRKAEPDQPIWATGSEGIRSRAKFRRLWRALVLLVSPIVYFEGVMRRGASITVYATPGQSSEA